MPVLPLSELPDWELADRSKDLRGKPLFDERGRHHGTIAELLVDTDASRVEAVRTDTGCLFPIEPLEIFKSGVVIHDASQPQCLSPESAVVNRRGAPDRGRSVEPHNSTGLMRGKRLRHVKVEAVDGRIGGIHDVYFDDQSWLVRYLVVDTARWLFGRTVLIAPEAVIRVDDAAGAIHLNLTRDRIRDSPSWDINPPVSRQHETALKGYYGWGGAMIPPGPVLGAPLIAGTPYLPVTPDQPTHLVEDASKDFDEHLRSLKEVTGYSIRADDETIGRVDDLLFHRSDLRVEAMLVKDSDRHQRLILPVALVANIDWPAAKIKVRGAGAAVRSSLEQSSE